MDDLGPGELEADRLDKLSALGGAPFLAHISGLSLQTLTSRLAEAQTAVAARDASGVRQAVHSIRSSATLIGARRLQQLARDAEMTAQAGDVAPLPALIAGLAVEIANVQVRLNELIAAGATAP